MREVTTEMKIYKIEILGISKTHWTGLGEATIQTDKTSTHYRMEEHKGEGTLLSKSAKRKPARMKNSTK
jgi:hypothetical protein